MFQETREAGVWKVTTGSLLPLSENSIAAIKTDLWEHPRKWFLPRTYSTAWKMHFITCIETVNQLCSPMAISFCPLGHWEGGNEPLPKGTENTSLHPHPFWQWGRDGFAQICGLCFGKQQLARSLALPQRHHSLLQLQRGKAFSPSSFSEKPHTQSAMRGGLLVLHCFPRAPSCCNSAEHHLLKQSFVYIKSYFKHGNGIILYLYRAIHPRGSQNVSATYGQQLFNSGWYDCTAVQGRSSTSNRNCRGNSGRWNWITQIAI